MKNSSFLDKKEEINRKKLLPVFSLCQKQQSMRKELFRNSPIRRGFMGRDAVGFFTFLIL